MTATLDRTTTKPKSILTVVANPTTRLIAGQRQCSGRKVAGLVIEAVGV